jgi:hypothetical protein
LAIETARCDVKDKCLILAMLMSIVLGASACGASDGVPVGASPAVSTPSADGRLSPTVAAVETQPVEDGADAETLSVSLAETEMRVRNDLALALNVPAAEIAVSEIVTRAWVDDTLECGAQKGVFQAVPVPGFQIALKYGDETYRYHADRQGRFVRCVEPGKPLGPIMDGPRP